MLNLISVCWYCSQRTAYVSKQSHGRDVELTTHLHLVPRSKNEWSYISTPPIRLHGVVLSQAQGQLYLLPYYLLHVYGTVLFQQMIRLF